MVYQRRPLTAQPLPPDDAYAALLRGEVDALFRIIGLGNPAVGELLKTGQFDLVPIEQIGALQLTQPYLEPTVIPQGSYDGGQPIPSEDLPVIAVSALLVANEAVDSRDCSSHYSDAIRASQ